MKRRFFCIILVLVLLWNLSGIAYAEHGAASGYKYTQVYEPECSWPMSATVAWLADESALTVAVSEVRPATAIVWLDATLKVYDRSGRLISASLDDYIQNSAEGMIPAFYIRNAAAANSLKTWLVSKDFQDCFVVSGPENKALVKSVADLIHVRGMLDYTSFKNPSRSELTQMVRAVNGAHGKVVILSYEAATRENIRFLQSLATTVWVQTPTDLKSILTQYTNGVNGVVVNDYQEAISALELFQDDAPSLLRLPQIIGHRGDPSVFVENTLDSAEGAYAEGITSIENDIQLSKDGQIFIYHDGYPKRFMGVEETDENGMIRSVESYTLEELRSFIFNWDDPTYGIIACNRVPADQSRYGTLYGQEEQKQYVVPTLQEYIDAFQTRTVVHFTEIKSYNDSILPALKTMLDRSSAWGQFSFISFNTAILDAVYRYYPEMPIGVLGTACEPAMNGYSADFHDYQTITDTEGTTAALQALYGDIDRWNATYNPYFQNYGEDMVLAGRHRGLTVWPWVYRIDSVADFGRDYLFGITGMTVDFPWIAADLLAEILSQDVACASEAEIPKPVGKTVSGASVPLESAELLMLDCISDTQSLMIWRVKEDLVLNGQYYGSYYLYSNPFVFRIGTPTGFSDVPEDAYYASPVAWAVENSITDGTNESTFSPDYACTRAQAVTFLWRAAGCPDITESSCPFYDIDPSDYYYDAVLWAVQIGVTNGTSDTTFSPNSVCTRAEIVTFLWRAFSCPSPESSPIHCFDDVSDDVYYSDPVYWAAETGITNGTSEDTFSPNTVCTRAQVVTFLYRAFRSISQ